MPEYYVFRAVNLPVDTTPDTLREALEYCKTKDEELNWCDIDIVHSCPYQATTVTAIFGVREPMPTFLAETRKTEESYTFMMGERDVEVDPFFLGFTQMYPTSPNERIVADIIAVHDLNGHAYGSWVGKGGRSRMWLRHFFRREFPSCRTMVYGYNSKLRSKSRHSVLDYTREFLDEVDRVRKTDEERKRPLLLIGHGFGGLLLARALIRARYNDAEMASDSLSALKATHGVLFFATPHRGMYVQTLASLLIKDGQPQRLELLNEINQDSNSVKEELDHFVDVCSYYGFQIYSFYETKETRELESEWKRNGAYHMVVSDNSALLQLPSKTERKIPLDANHSNIVKFKTEGNRDYKKVQGAMVRLLESLQATVTAYGLCNSMCQEDFS